MTSATPDLSVADRLRVEHGAALTLGAHCDLPEDLVIELDDGAHLTIGDGVSIRRGSTIQVHRGATVAIGNDVTIGEHTFISAMAGIRLSDGAALSNMVDLHDHNHRERSTTHVPTGQLVPWASGFEAAPIIIEPGAILSNKVTVIGGVRIGANALIGANAVVSHTVAPDTVASGVPATAHRCFNGATAPVIDDRRTLTVGFFGTSIMEHLEGYNAQLVNQANLPEVGSQVTVEEWRPRGWVQRLALSLRAAWPYVTFDVKNHGEGGATSRDIAGIVARDRRTNGLGYDLVFLSCGINDVWRTFQGRTAEAVGIEEYAGHVAAILKRVSGYSRRIVVLSETPFGSVEAPEVVAEMNGELVCLNQATAKAAAEHGALFLDVWTPFTAAARQLATAPADHETASLWSDGVHLSELGDALVLRQVEGFLADHRLITKLLDYPRLDREQAVQTYRPMFAHHRPTGT
ncbi:MAG: GDSL-type esterase/lipase family protein [Pseudonocardiaceae bacterium]